MEITVKHEVTYQQFTISFEGVADDAEMAYALPDEGVINITHTYVPPSERGKGLVQKLLEEALRFASENNYEVRASCPVAAKYLERQKS